MKRIIIAFVGAGALAMGAAAAPVTPEQALERAAAEITPASNTVGSSKSYTGSSKGFATGSNDTGGAARMAAAARSGQMRLAYVQAAKAEGETAGEAAVYVFNRGEGDGFLVLPADDCAPAVLGYSDSGAIASDEAQIPDGLRYWLGTLADQIAWRNRNGNNQGFLFNGKTNGSKHVHADRQEPGIDKVRTDREPIPPLCTTRWNQSEPYYNFCPTLNQQRCYTGCVATAMAQAMKYHNWPETGEGSNSYSWGSTVLRMDFSKVTFEWDAMLDSYAEDNYTREEANAVANLMRACGISVNMNYSPSGSGALSSAIAGALGSYFKYDKSVRYEKRDFYSLNDWETMIYNSLKNNGPVIYNGQSYEGGHSFICDGYDKDGYFHFNWGWGGMSDGYFLLDALDPISQGIGGSLSGTGFDFTQDIVLDIRPDRTGTSTWTPQLMAQGFAIDTEKTYKTGEEITTTGWIVNYGPATIPAETLFGMLFTGEDGSENAYPYSTDTDLPINRGFQNLAYLSPEDLPDGKYRVTMGFKIPDGEWKNVLMPILTPEYYTATVTGGVISFEAAETPYIEADIVSHSDIEVNQELSIEMNVTNPTASPFYASIIGVLVKNGEVAAEALQTPLDIDGGATIPVSYKSTMSAARRLNPGVYEFYMCYTDGYMLMSFTEPIEVKIESGSGVEELETSESDAPVVYYDLQGNVTEPVKGAVVIRRQGSKTEKIVY